MERKEFEPWMDEDRLVAGREVVCTGTDSYTINNLAITKVPEPEWLREDVINGERITEWWSKKDELKTNGLDFGVELGASKPGVGKWKEAAKKFLDEHRDEIPRKKERRENPKGYPGVLKGALPEFIHIPAVRDISEEAKVAKTNPFGQLINSVLEKISEEQKDVVSKQLKEIEKLLNRGEEERITEIMDIEARLNKLMSEFMDCDIEIEMAMPQLREVFGGAKIYANDGVRTTIETKGHGMQRSMIFTILRAYAELAHVKKAGEKAGERTTIFAIEEPELYLHPQSQRTSMSVFREIASGGDQVIYSTQSGLFVDISHFDQICIMRREKRDGSYESYPTQVSMSTMIEDLEARKKGVDATEEGIREHYSHAFNPMINEGFFADKVVIVEGPSEQYALPIYADAFGYNLDRNTISVVHSDGKGQMDRLLRAFNGFKIPTYLWFDGDKNSDKRNVRDKTLELLELLGDPVEKIEDVETKVSDRYAILEYNFEETLKDELGDYEDLVQQAGETLGPIGKPLKHRFVANRLKQRVDNGESPEEVLPKTIIKIVQKIKELSYSGSILQKVGEVTT